MRAFLRGLKVLPFAVGLTLVGVCLWLQLTTVSSVADLRERLEFLAYDLRLNAALRGHTPAPEPVVIVDIDERSLQQEGQWPWPRQRLAALVDVIRDSGAAVLALDMVFAEEERNALQQLLAELDAANPAQAPLRALLEKSTAGTDGNRQLADSLRGIDSVLGVIFHNQAAPPVGTLPHALLTLDSATAASSPLLVMPSYSANLPTLQSATPYGGFLTALPDSDGVIRSVPLLLRHGDEVYPSLALEAARLFLLQDKVEIVTARVGAHDMIEQIVLGNTRLHTDGNGRVLVPYRGKAGTFRHVSASDVLRRKHDPALLENNIVLIGASALALADLKATPVQSVFPGNEVHANIIAGILDGRFPAVPSWASGANIVLILSFGVLLALLLPLLGPGRQLLATALALTGVVYFNGWLWSHEGLALAVTIQIAMILALAAFNLAYGFLFEARSKGQLKDMFGQYVPPQLVEEMSRDPVHYHADGESREMSVLFADIRDFTSISESLEAAALKDLLNRFFTPMTELIFERRGTIDKYVGDLIMAFWGAPIHDARHAEHAVGAALEMLRAAQRLREEFQGLGLPSIQIGIGINSGLMNVGDMGSKYRRAYTVIGDAVNLASRLEGLSKFYGASLIVSDDTRRQAPGFVYRPLDRVRVKGKQQAVVVYEVLCPTSALTAALAEELGAHDQALQRLWSRDWDAAERAFTTLAAQHPETRVYRLYLERIKTLRNMTLPDSWDGTFDRREK